VCVLNLFHLFTNISCRKILDFATSARGNVSTPPPGGIYCRTAPILRIRLNGLLSNRRDAAQGHAVSVNPPPTTHSPSTEGTANNSTGRDDDDDDDNTNRPSVISFTRRPNADNERRISQNYNEFVRSFRITNGFSIQVTFYSP